MDLQEGLLTFGAKWLMAGCSEVHTTYSEGASISRRVSEDRMAAAGAMLTAIFSHAADRSGLKAD